MIYPVPGRIRVTQIVKACILDSVSFINYVQYPPSITEDMIRGIGIHGLVLEGRLPPEIVELDFSDFRAKAARQERDTVLNEEKYPVRAGIPKRWESVIDSELLKFFEGCIVEKPMFGELSGFGKIQGRLDGFDGDAVLDLKTTTAQAFRDIKAHIYRFGYDIQMYLYMQLAGVKKASIALMDAVTGCWKSVSMELDVIESSVQGRLAIGARNLALWGEYQIGYRRQDAEEYAPPMYAVYDTEFYKEEE